MPSSAVFSAFRPYCRAFSGRGLVARVVVVLRLAAHGERAGHGDLHLAGGVRLQEQQVLDLDRVAAADRAGDARHRVGVSGTVERGAGVVQVHAVQRGGEAVAVALAPDLAVGDDVQPGVFLRADRDQRGVLPGLLQVGLGHAPQLLGAHAGREATGQLGAVDQPLGLGKAADDGGREQHGGSPGTEWVSRRIVTARPAARHRAPPKASHRPAENTSPADGSSVRASSSRHGSGRPRPCQGPSPARAPSSRRCCGGPRRPEMRPDRCRCSCARIRRPTIGCPGWIGSPPSAPNMRR